MRLIDRKWRREGKGLPFTGKLFTPPACTSGYLIAKQNLRRSLSRHLFSPLQRTNTEAPQYAFCKAWRNLSGPMWSRSNNPNPGVGPTASRWSAPSPGNRTCREDHAPSHRPQMSSGRLFLERVGRHQWNTRRARLDKQARNWGAVRLF